MNKYLTSNDESLHANAVVRRLALAVSLSTALLCGCGVLEKEISTQITYSEYCQECVNDAQAITYTNAQLQDALEDIVKQRLGGKTPCPFLLPDDDLARLPTCALQEILNNNSFLLGSDVGKIQHDAAQWSKTLAHKINAVEISANSLLQLIKTASQSAKTNPQTTSAKVASILHTLTLQQPQNANKAAAALKDLQITIADVKDYSETILQTVNTLTSNAGPANADKLRVMILALRAWQQNLNTMLDKGKAVLTDSDAMQRDLTRLATEPFVARYLFDLIERSLTPLEKQIRSVDEKNYGVVTLGMLFTGDSAQTQVDSAISKVLEKISCKQRIDLTQAYGRLACQRLFKPESNLGGGYIGPLVARAFINAARNTNAPTCSALETMQNVVVTKPDSICTAATKQLASGSAPEFQQFLGLEFKLRQAVLQQQMAIAAPAISSASSPARVNALNVAVPMPVVVNERLIEDQAAILAGQQIITIQPGQGLVPTFSYGTVVAPPPINIETPMQPPGTNSVCPPTAQPDSTVMPTCIPVPKPPLFVPSPCAWVPMGLSCQTDATGRAVVSLPGFANGAFNAPQVKSDLLTLGNALQRAGLRASVEVHGHASREAIACSRVQDWLAHPPSDWPLSGIPPGSAVGTGLAQSRWPTPCRDANDDGNRALSVARAAWATRILVSATHDLRSMDVQQVLGWGSDYADVASAPQDRRVTLYFTLLPQRTQ